MKKNIIIWVAIVVIVGVGAFFGGEAVGRSSAASNLRSRFAAFGNGAGAFGNRAGGNGTSVLAGSVLSMDSQSLTLQGRDGSSHVVFYSTSTEVSQPTVVPVSALKAGENVTVMGTSNSDGSFTASSIDIRPNGPAGVPSQAGVVPVPTSGQ